MNPVFVLKNNTTTNTTASTITTTTTTTTIFQIKHGLTTILKNIFFLCKIKKKLKKNALILKGYCFLIKICLFLLFKILKGISFLVGKGKRVKRVYPIILTEI